MSSEGISPEELEHVAALAINRDGGGGDLTPVLVRSAGSLRIPFASITSVSQTGLRQGHRVRAIPVRVPAE